MQTLAAAGRFHVFLLGAEVNPDDVHHALAAATGEDSTEWSVDGSVRAIPMHQQTSAAGGQAVSLSQLAMSFMRSTAAGQGMRGQSPQVWSVAFSDVPGWLFMCPRGTTGSSTRVVCVDAAAEPLLRKASTAKARASFRINGRRYEVGDATVVAGVLAKGGEKPRCVVEVRSTERAAPDDALVRQLVGLIGHAVAPREDWEEVGLPEDVAAAVGEGVDAVSAALMERALRYVEAGLR